MKEYEQVRTDMNDAIGYNYDRNKMCMEDYEFATVSGAMWKGSYAENFVNKPKPEINKIFTSINRLLGKKQRMEMNATIVSNSDEATDEDADTLQSRWRNDFQNSDGAEALNNADQEAFFGGFGAYKIVSKYEDDEDQNPEKQYLCLEPIYSAPSCVIYSPSVRKDKADSKQGWHILRTNKKEAQEMFGTDISSVNSQIEWFDWEPDTAKDIYLAHYYEVVEKTITEYDFGGYKVTSGDGIKDDAGNKMTRDELKELRELSSYTTKRKKVKYVEYALMDGSRFLTKVQRLPFKRVPIIPQYGYYNVINGIEYFFGEVRKRRDLQMFLNAYNASLMQIMEAPQVEVPEYTPEQINRHAGQRAKAKVDNAAFVMSDPLKDKDGNIKHVGPIGKQMPPNIGTGLAAAGQQLNTDLIDMAGMGTQTVPSNAAADAIKQVNERQDDAFQPLMQNSMAAIKAACEIWIDAAQEIYFSNKRNLRVMAQDGTYSQVETLGYAVNADGDFGPYKNAARGKYTVQVKTGETYQSKKEAELETTLKMLQFADTNSPDGQMLLNQAIMSTTGEGGERARMVANFKVIDYMLQMGLDPKAKTDEEREFVQRRIQATQQQQQQPSAQEIALLSEAKAREMEGQAAIQNEINDATKNQIEIEKVKNDRAKVMIEADKVGAQIGNINMDTNLKAANINKSRVDAFKTITTN